MILFQIALILYGWYSFTDWPYLYSLSNSLAIFVLFVRSHLSTGRYESRGIEYVLFFNRFIYILKY